MPDDFAALAIPPHVPRDRVIDFDLNDLSGIDADFFLAWTSLQRQGLPDLVWTPHCSGHWIVTRGALIHELFPDTVRLSNRAGSTNPVLGDLTRLIPVQSDPPKHAQYRSAVLKGFSAKLLIGIEPEIRDRARALVADLAPRGGCEFMTEFAEDLPVSVFLSLIDLPQADRPALRELVTSIHRPDGTKTAAELVAQMHDYLRPYALGRLAKPGNDLMSRILATPLGGEPWNEDEALRLASNLLVGGLDTVAAMFGFTAHFLAQSPRHRAVLAADRGIVPRAADEFIRRFAPANPVREVIADFELDGVTLKKGDIIVLPTMLHNLDERSIEDAMAVKFDRAPVEHSTMGHGAHRCVGAGLARLEMIVFLEEWFARIPDFELDPERPCKLQFGGVGTFTALPLRWAR